MRATGCFLLVMAASTLTAQDPTLQWAHTLGTASHTHGVVVDGSGAVITVGIYQTTMDLDPGPGVVNVSSNSGSADVFIRKVDANGSFLWGGSIGGNSTEEGWAVAVDAQDNVLLTGRVLGTVDLDPTVAGTLNVTSVGNSSDVFVVKLSPSGVLLWGRIFGGTLMDSGHDIAADAAGNVYTAGTIGAASDMDPGAGTVTVGGNGMNDAFVQKLDPNGQFIWARAIGGTAHDEGWGVAVTPAGTVSFAGEFRNTMDLDPGAGVQSVTASGSTDGFVEQLDLNGAFTWGYRFGGTSVETARAIAVDGTGACIFTGDINSATDMDPGPGTFMLPGDFTEDAYLTKLSSTGALEWAILFSGFLNHGLFVSVDAADNVYTAGSFGGTMDIDPGPGVTNLVGSATDGYLIRYSPAGTLDWGFIVTGLGNQSARVIAAGPNNSVVAGGSFINTMDVEPGPGTTNLTAVGSAGSAWMAAYAQSTSCASIAVQAKLVLEGPWKPADQLMVDSLRVGGWLPLNEPYTALGFAVTAPEPTTSGVLAVTGINAIVDWVLVQLRAQADPTQVVETRAALLQRDGDVVAANGSSPVVFCAPAGDYHVAVLHRNHLGVMTASHTSIGGTPVIVDFTLPATAVFGTEPRHDLNGVMVLWPGNVVPNTFVSYTGAGNDRDPILVRVGGTIPTNTVQGYWPEDVNLDATVKYTGSGNDRDPILLVVGGVTPNSTRTQQLP